MITAFTFTPQFGVTGEIKQLIWDDLIPSEVLADDPLEEMTQELQDTVTWVIYMLENLPERNEESEDIYQELDQAMPEIEKAGIDVNKIMEYKRKLFTSVVQELSGRKVSMPGYLLPLEMSGSKVTEFFLVPYIGACIHAPPPPPNQIVHVTITNTKGYKNKTLYDPVIVTGVIRVKSSVKELFLVDGSSDIDIGYSMEATDIKPYE